MEQRSTLLETLNTITPLHPDQKQTNFEKFAVKLRKVSFLMAISLLLISIALAGVHGFLHPLPDYIKITAISMIVIAQLLIPVGWLIEIIAGITSFVYPRTNNLRLLRLEMEHDHANAQRLLTFSRKTLIEMKDWLDLKRSRMEERLTHFSLDPKTLVAIVSIATTALPALKTLQQPTNVQQGTLLSSILDNPLSITIILALVFGFGLWLGTIALKIQRMRHGYHLEIIQLALSKKTTYTKNITHKQAT